MGALSEAVARQFGPQFGQGLGEEAADVHLGDADLGGDLGLGEVAVEAQGEDFLFAVVEGGEGGAEGDLRKGSVVTCEVTEVKEGGLDVKIVGSDLTTFIKRSELARDRGEQRPERFAVGQKVISIDRRTQKVQVSIKALEVAEEKEAIAQYGSTDSGATLGDILGTALKRVTDKPDEKEE